MVYAAKPDFEQNLADFGSARFTQLRPDQLQVLAAYAEHHLDAADLAIEMPTAEGKTAVGSADRRSRSHTRVVRGLPDSLSVLNEEEAEALVASRLVDRAGAPMPDLSHHARQLRELADALDAQSDLADDPLEPHPDTLEVINGRHTSRGQINYAVPDALQLQRRIRRYHADHGVQHGDIVAIALDAFLRARGYPPDLPSTKAEER